MNARQAGAGYALVPLPTETATPGTTLELRLAVDPVDDSLVAALARLDADGVTRDYAWRLTTTTGPWEALPALEIGRAPSFEAGLGGFALAAQAGEVTLAWSCGSVSFSSTARLALTVMRHAGGAWAALGNPGTLPDAARGSGLQPMGLSLAPTCSGGVFPAWNEPQQYPRGEVLGAQFSAAPDGTRSAAPRWPRCPAAAAASPPPRRWPPTATAGRCWRCAASRRR